MELLQLGMVLLVGCGGKMGLHYLDKLTKMGVDPRNIVGVDINPERLRNAAEMFPGAIFLDSIEKAWGYDPKWAIITTNSPVHKRIIEELYARGVVNIFCEKPLVYFSSDVESLEQYDNRGLYVAHLINFSGIVGDLLGFMKQNNLIISQGFAKWGKNWPSEKRPMGGDAEEELPHPLALLLALVNSEKSSITNVAVVASSTTCLPHVQPQYLEAASKLDLGFPDIMNDSTLAAILVSTDRGEIPLHITTSFNFFEQVRRVEVSLEFEADQPGSIPEYKACLDFDIVPLRQLIDAYGLDSKMSKSTIEALIGVDMVNSLSKQRDRLRIKNAQTEEIVFSSEYFEDKIQANLAKAMETFAGGQPDGRLVDFKHAANLVRIIEKILK